MTTVTNNYTDEALDRGNMNTVAVRKSELIEILQQNRESHRASFDEAIQGYRARSIELLEEHIQRIRSGKVERVLVSLPVPEDHTDDYDRVIAQMNWDIREEIELTSREFDQYVRDNWTWKQEFLTTSGLYTGSGQ